MSSIQTVPISDAAGVAITSSVAIPAGTTQLIISNSTDAFYLALNEIDLDNEYARILFPTQISTTFRMDIPEGVGVLFVEPATTPSPSAFISFWLA